MEIIAIIKVILMCLGNNINKTKANISATMDRTDGTKVNIEMNQEWY